MIISAQPELMRLSQQPGRPMVEIDMARLAGHLPLLAGLGRAERQALAAQARVHDLPAATAIVRYGEQSGDAFILLGGRAVAGLDVDGSYRTFEMLNVGDLFGEIGALTGVPRTASVITIEPSTVLQLPAAVLRQLMDDSCIRRYFLSRMAERMLRMDLIDPPHHYIPLDSALLERRPADRDATMLLAPVALT